MRLQPETATHLIGRQTEIDVIQQHIDATVTGAGSLLLFSGEAGVGKSRLVTELVERFQSSSPSSHVLTGNCFEGDHRLAYAPILDLLRSYLMTRPHNDLQQLFRHDPDSFITLLPEHQRRFPGIAPLTGINPQQDKHRIFQALRALLVDLAGDQPLLIIFEDLHWSDDTSLEFLTHLARSASTLPLLVVGTFRTEEEQPSLRRALVEVSRGRHAVELRLGHLTIDEVDLLLRNIFEQQHAIRSDFLHAIYELTEGNPFFIEETVRSLIAEGDILPARGRWTRRELEHLHIPRSVKDALARSTEPLNQVDLEVLEFAAVIGKRCDVTLLKELVDYPDTELLQSLRALTDARLLVEESADRFRFRHALIRESVYEQLLGWERQARHARVAEAIESLSGSDPDPWLADLAYHWRAAARWENALDYAVAAGNRAQALFTPHAAIEHFTAAIEAMERLGQQPSTQVFRKRGRAYETLGDFEAARDDFAAARDIARARGDQYQEWETIIDLGRTWEGIDYDRAGDWFERAIDLARQLDSPSALASSLNRLGTWYCNIERVDEARTAHLEALRIFEELGDESGVGETVDYLGTVADIAGDAVEMHARYAQAAEIFERHGDRHRLASVLASMAILNGAFVFEAVSTSHSIPYQSAAEWCERSLQLARDSDWRIGETYALMNLAGLQTAAARYQDAFDSIQQAREIARDTDHLEWLASTTAVLGYLYQQILALDLAIESLSEAASLARSSGSRHHVHLVTSHLVDALVENEEAGHASEILSAFPNEMPMRTVGERRLWAARANWELANGSPDAALDTVERLFETGHNVMGQRSIPAVAWLRGRALTMLGRTDEAEKALSEAHAGYAALVHPGKLWRIHLELARLFHSQGRSADATNEIGALRRIVERIAPGIPDDTLRQNFLRKIDGMISAVPDSDSENGHALANLTPRERDVVRLITRGLSNRQIAEELFIGERTVETHVGNILRKLNLDSRTQVVARLLDPNGASNSE